MSKGFLRWGFVLVAAALYFGVVAGPASAAYEFDPKLSLRGDCGTANPDFVPDPGCPGGDHPPAGRFQEPKSVAIDAYGNEYVASHAFDGDEGRIDVFDDEGNFITELPDPRGPKAIAVDSEGNLYVLEQIEGAEAEIALYEPTVYKPLLGEIEYDGAEREVVTTEITFSGGLAVDFTNDHLYAAYNKDFMEEFDSAKEGNALLETIELPMLEDEGSPAAPWWNNWVAVDGQRQRLYASYCKDGFNKCGILVLSADPSYELLEEIDGSTVPAKKFVSLKGWISPAVDESTGHFLVADLEASKNIYEFDENFNYLETLSFSKFEGPNSLQIAISNSPLNPTANNLDYLFVPLPKDAGAVFAFEPRFIFTPKVSDLFATNVSEREAELRATVDPRGATTEYVFEYVTQADFDATGFDNAKSAGAGTIPAGASKTVFAAVSGLTPGTTYRFRIVAENEKGKDADSEEEGTFSTYSDAPIGGGCPNEIFRIGFSASLPDCRAYELVTPADTNGRPPKGVGFGGDRFPTVEVSPSGNTVSFVTEGGSLPGTEGTGGFNGDLYRTSRSTSGWGNVIRTGPTGTETNNPSPGSTSSDQEHAFFWASGEGTAVVDGVITHYVRYPDGRAELVGRGSLGTDPSAIGQWISEGGDHIIFQTQSISGNLSQQLEPDAAPSGTRAVYDRTSDEVTHVVSLLPGDVPAKEKEDATYLDASADGTGIAFSIGDTVYLRLDNEVTFEIGKNVTLADVSESGRRVFYLEGGDLFAFDTDSEGVVRFSEVGNATVVNVAPDGSRAYFVSTSVIADAGENPNAAAPVAGQQNLYLSEEGQTRFVGTLTAEDVEGKLGLWTTVQAAQLAQDPSRVTPDGSVLLFESRANLGGYDPDGFPQVYRYDSIGNRLHCVSCPPTGTPANGGASLETYAEAQTTPPPFTAFGFVPNLRADGKRAFFESDQALVAADANEVQDVYEWEEEGVGSCTRPGGCVYLISSGHSARDNYLYGVSASGDDVFFITDDVLVGGDNDTPSIYDARVGGGFPEAAEEECQGEGCRSPLTPAPVLNSPARPALGADDQAVKPKPPARRCQRGKRKVKRNGKVRCVKVKKHRKKHQRKAGARKGAGR